MTGTRDNRMIEADRDVDARYGWLRDRHGGGAPQANGYLLSSFFEREQRLLLSRLDRHAGPFLDIACGSGLMLAPLAAEGLTVHGLDFNEEACGAARDNGIAVIRGDAFNLPFADASIGQIVNCQFLNQQTTEQARRFIAESARVLRPGGQVLILWRHARSLLHVATHGLFGIFDRVTGKPAFPQFVHPLARVAADARGCGLEVRHRAVTLPAFRPATIGPDNPLAAILGASLFIVLAKP